MESFGASRTNPFTPQEITLLKDVESGRKEYYSLPQELQTKLFDHFAAEMPYGVQKARTGDPDEWITDHLGEITNGSVSG